MSLKQAQKYFLNFSVVLFVVGAVLLAFMDSALAVNSITRTTPTDSRAGARSVIWIEGYKYSGTADSGGNQSSSGYITVDALQGTAEENIVESGTSHASVSTYHDGSGTRNVIYEAGQNFRSTSMDNMTVVRTDTGAIVTPDIGGPYHDYRLKTTTAFPLSTAYEIHGYASTTPANYLNAFQWNLIYIHTGTGKGQVRRIKSVYDDGSTVYLITSADWTTTPDNTSQFYIAWSPMDIIYASNANGWEAGNIHFDELGLIPIMVEITSELEIGNSGVSTYFGWSNLFVWGNRKGGMVSVWGDTYWTKNAEAIIFFGTGDYGADSSETPVAQEPAIMGGNNSQGWGGHIGFGAEIGIDSRIAGGLFFGDATFGNKNTYALYANSLTGTLWSYNNRRLSSVPGTSNSVGDYVLYYGWTWGTPMAGSLSGGNGIVLDIRGTPTDTASPANYAGLGWYGQNSGSFGDYFMEMTNSNLGLTNFKDSSDRECDYWGIYPFSDYKWQWYEKKTIDITVTNPVTSGVLSGATVTITNQNGDTVSETDSGTDITADMNKTTTSISVDLLENLTTGDLVRIDNEYITLGTVSGSGSGTITGCTREARYPNYFRKLPHKYNTASYNKNIYIIKALTTDANGQIEQQKLTAFSMTADSTGSGYPSQVTKDSVNYTANTVHQAEDGVNSPPNASYWDVAGTDGFPWEDGKFYTTGANGARSYVTHTPWTVTVSKPGSGLQADTNVLTPSIDNEGINLSVKLNPKPDGEVKVLGVEYVSNETGMIYIEILDQNGSPVNTAIASSTVYDSSGNAVSGYENLPMTYITGSNGKYRLSSAFTAPSTEGVYVIDTIAEWTCSSATCYAYASDDIHVSQAANSAASSTPSWIWSYGTRDLTDYATSSISQAVWGYSGRSLDTITNIVTGVWDTASSTLTTAGSIGKHLVDNIDDTISNVASNVWGYSTRTLSSFGTLVSDIWSNGTRTLTAFGTLAADIWNNTFAPTRRLTDKTLTGGGSLSTESYVDTATSTMIAQLDDIEYDVDLIRGATFDFSGFADAGSSDTTLVDSELSQPDDYWNNYRLIMVSGVNVGEEQTVSDFDAASDTLTVSSVFTSGISAGDKYVLLHEDRLVYQIWNATTRTLSSFGTLVSDVWSSATRRLTDDTLTDGGNLATKSYVDTATSTIVGAGATDLTTLSGYIDEVEGYIGVPADTATSTLFGAIKDVRTKLEQLDTLETKLDTVDAIVDLIRASQQLNYTVELSDVGEVLQSNTYRVKLSVWDYENNPANTFTTPTIIIYDSSRSVATSSSMTATSTGVYEFTFTVPSDATSGLWETVVNADLGGSSSLTLNDYWEVEGSPAQVIINSISDATVPSITANTIIENEGNAGYEYQYEWCVVDSEDNICGGGDDTYYASAAKYLSVGQVWTTDLSATVSNTGDYWFKVVVYYGSEASGASRTFSAVEEEEEGVQSGAVILTTSSSLPAEKANLTNIYSKLLELQDELGYHDTDRTVHKDLINTKYSLGDLPEELDSPIYTILSELSAQIKSTVGEGEYGLDEIYEISSGNSSDLKYIKNKNLELQAMIDVNKLLIDKVANEPIVNSWYEWGSVVLKIIIINPSSSQVRIIPFKHYLPREVDPKYIIDKEDLEIDFDQERDLWFVHKEIELDPGESTVKKVEIKDIWVVSDEKIISLRNQAKELAKPLEGTSYFAQAATLKSDINRYLDSISRKQKEYQASPEEHIVSYRENLESLWAAESNITALKAIATDVSGQSGILGSLFGVSTTMVWAIILIVVVGVAVLMILLYSILMRSRALEEYIAPGKKLKASSVIKIGEKTLKTKSGFLAYILPPYGKQTIDAKRLTKQIKILSTVIIIIIILILIAVYFSSSTSLDKGLATANLNILEDKSITENIVFDEEMENTQNLEETITYTGKAEEKENSSAGIEVQKKLKITETGTGWLNARSGPSLNSGIIAKVNVDDEFIYTDIEEGLDEEFIASWYKIILEDEENNLATSTAWVYGEYIEIISNL